MDIGQQVRRATWDPGSANYLKLKTIRQMITAKRLKVMKMEKTLASARSSLYALNKTLRKTGTTYSTAACGDEDPADKVEKELYFHFIYFDCLFF